MTTASVKTASDEVTLIATKPFNSVSRDVGDDVLCAASGKRKIRLLVLTSLYPNAAQPRHGVFVEERLRHLVDSGRIAATVVAPVPWFPFRSPMFGAYSRFAAVPETEERYGIKILHPRYPVIPKVGMNVAPFLMYRALLPGIRRLLSNDPDYDLIDTHYLYPDGVAAVALGRSVGRPVIATARGNDVNLIPSYRIPRQQILRAAGRAAAVVTVSQALRARLVALGMDAKHICVLRNGVDLERFGPRDRTVIRAKLGLTDTVWLTVSHLVERKGVHIVVEALAKVPHTTLLIAGDGPEGHKLRSLVERLGLGTRVRFLGTIRHDELCEYYNAADLLLLASVSEGMPNVILESLACGTPVVAAPFDGITELLSAPEAGEIATERNVEAIVSAWLRLRDRAPARAITRAFAERLGWQPVVQAQCELYARALRASAPVERPVAEP